MPAEARPRRAAAVQANQAMAKARAHDKEDAAARALRPRNGAEAAKAKGKQRALAKDAVREEEDEEEEMDDGDESEPESEEEEEEDDDDDDDEKEATLQPKTPKPRTVAATTQTPDANNLYEACRAGPSSLVVDLGKALVKSALVGGGGERTAVCRLVALTLRSAGLDAADAAVAPSALDQPNAMDALVDAKADIAAAATRTDTKAAARMLTRGMQSLWKAVAGALCASEAALRGSLLQTLSDFAVKMAACSVRPMRSAGADVALALMSALVSAAAPTHKERSATQRQLEATKGGSSGRANTSRTATLTRLLETAQSKLERLHDRIQAVFHGAFTHRFRDVDPAIRKACIESLGAWVAAYPDHFLEDSYLKYLGWALNDQDAHVRRSALAALKPLYGPKRAGSVTLQAMDLFTQRFAPRVLQMTNDKDDAAVRIAAVVLVRAMAASGAAEASTFFLATSAAAAEQSPPAREQMLAKMRELTMSPDQGVRAAAGELLAEVHLATAPAVAVTKGRAKNYDDGVLGAVAALAALVSDATDDELVSVVDAITDAAPDVLQDWALLADCVMCDEAAAALASAADLNNTAGAGSSAPGSMKQAKKARGSGSRGAVVACIALRRSLMRLLSTSVRRTSHLARGGASKKRDAARHADAHQEATRVLAPHAPVLLRLFGPGGVASDDIGLSAAIATFAALKLEVYTLRRAEDSFAEALRLVHAAVLSPAPAPPAESTSWAAACACFAALADAEAAGEAPAALHDAISTETTALADTLADTAAEATTTVSVTLNAPSSGGGKRGRGAPAAAASLVDIESLETAEVLASMQRLHVYLHSTGGVGLVDNVDCWAPGAKGLGVYIALRDVCRAVVKGCSVHASIERYAMLCLFDLACCAAYSKADVVQECVDEVALAAEHAVRPAASGTRSDYEAMLYLDGVRVLCDLACMFAPVSAGAASFVPSATMAESLVDACEAATSRLVSDPEAMADLKLVEQVAKVVCTGVLYASFPEVTHMLFATLARPGATDYVREVAKVAWDQCRRAHRFDIYVPSVSGVTELLYERTVLPLMTAPDAAAMLAWEPAENAEEESDERLERRMTEFKTACAKLYGSLGLPSHPATAQCAVRVLRRGLTYLLHDNSSEVQQLLRLRFATGLSALVAKLSRDALKAVWPSIKADVKALKARAESFRDDASVLKALKEALPKELRADAGLSVSEAITAINAFTNALAEKAGMDADGNNMHHDDGMEMGDDDIAEEQEEGNAHGEEMQHEEEEQEEEEEEEEEEEQQEEEEEEEEEEAAAAPAPAATAGRLRRRR